MLITANQKAAELILHDYLLAPIITRFGIKPGFGEKTIAQVCRDYDIPSEFFLEIVNAFHDPDYFPNKKLQGFSLKLLVDYLLKSHKYYLQVKIPKIEQYIHELEWDSNDEENRKLLSNFFHQYHTELVEHTTLEESVVYPYVLELESALSENRISEELAKKIQDYPITSYKDEHSDIDSKLLDLKNIIIKYLPPPNDLTALNELLSEVFKLERDLTDHTRIENKVLIPKVEQIEKQLLRII